MPNASPPTAPVVQPTRIFLPDQLIVQNRYARSGPRVAAVLKTKSGRYVAAPGFVDEDTDTVKQVALVTPDGRIWVIL